MAPEGRWNSVWRQKLLKRPTKLQDKRRGWAGHAVPAHGNVQRPLNGVGGGGCGGQTYLRNALNYIFSLITARFGMLVLSWHRLLSAGNDIILLSFFCTINIITLALTFIFPASTGP
jgi:hypothetical protein